jgi:hypothetical protein
MGEAYTGYNRQFVGHGVHAIRGNFFKEVSVIILVQGKMMLLLLKVCKRCIE